MSTQSILGSGACGTWNLLPSQFQTLAVLVTAAVRTEQPNLATIGRRRDRPTTRLNNSFAKDDGPATRPRRRGDASGCRFFALSGPVRVVMIGRRASNAPGSALRFLSMGMEISRGVRAA